MQLDKDLIFGLDQAITGDAASTDYIDQENAGPFQNSDKIKLVVTCTEDFDNLTNLKISFQDSADASTWVERFSRTIVLASLTAGTKILELSLPVDLLRYLRVYYDVTGTDPTAGQVSAFLKWG